MKILAIIPARKGSKGIYLKNIRKVDGKPLLAYSIEAAKKSKLVNRIIVSTENSKIANIAKRYGAEVPFLRPKKFSTDLATNLDVLKHTLKILKNNSYVPDMVLLLQPTSPLRNSKMIDDSIKILKKSKATSVIAVKEIQTHPYASFKLNRGFLKPLNYNFQKYRQRQKRPTFYFPTGSIYTFWYNNFKKYNSIYGPKIKPIIVKADDDIDVDSTFDFFMVEMIQKYWKNYQKQFHKS